MGYIGNERVSTGDWECRTDGSLKRESFCDADEDMAMVNVITTRQMMK